MRRAAAPLVVRPQQGCPWSAQRSVFLRLRATAVVRVVGLGWAVGAVAYAPLLCVCSVGVILNAGEFYYPICFYSHCILLDCHKYRRLFAKQFSLSACTSFQTIARRNKYVVTVGEVSPIENLGRRARLGIFVLVDFFAPTGGRYQTVFRLVIPRQPSLHWFLCRATPLQIIKTKQHEKMPLLTLSKGYKQKY